MIRCIHGRAAQVRSSRLRTARAVVLFTVAFAASASGVWIGARRIVDAAGIERIGLSLDFATNLRAWRDALVRDRTHHRVAFIGDSTLMTADGMQKPGNQALPGPGLHALHQLNERGKHMQVHTLCSPGLGPAGHYFLSDSVGELRPDTVVLSLNLRAFNAQYMKRFGYPELAGWLDAEHMLEAAALPLVSRGPDARPLASLQGARQRGRGRPVARSTAAAGPRLQAARAARRAGGRGARHDRKRADAVALGIARLHRSQVPERDSVASRGMAEQVLGPVVRGLGSDDPTLRILAAALRRLHAASVPTLSTWDRRTSSTCARSGSTGSRIDASLQTIQRTVEREGAHFADFHALLPDSRFRDAGDHYTFEGDPDGTTWLSYRIAVAIMNMATPTVANSEAHALQ